MNTSQLKAYAPKARTEFIKAVSAQAARFGITAKGVAEARVQGDLLMVGGQAFPRSFANARQQLVERVKAVGFDRAMEVIAYTWFNRFVAMRYMELHGYLEHGYRVLSHPEGHGRPEILDHAADVDLPGLDRDRVVELKLAGNKDEELYRMLLLAQCNALHQAMPFLFEKIGDETELLLPANLLHTDSLIRQLVEQVDEALWQEIEIIGWLYQFYISEKKAQVIGKVVKSEDIPAATQLFTPNWIVKYMVQNSLGAQWLATYPQSPLKGQMEYYIEPAEQTDEVNAQLAAITPKTLDPEKLTLIDPACGSGHILVEAYELFKAIYLERGYRQRDVPQLILEKNLFGLDIDERAAQLTGFALMMKGRADDRRLFDRGVKLNVMALVDSAGFDAEGLAKGVELGGYGLKPGDLTELKRLFEHATTFGSLIQVPGQLVDILPALRHLSESTSSNMFVAKSLELLRSLVQQAELLAAHYDVAVANPPYMGSGAMNMLLKEFVESGFPIAKGDLFTCFIERGCMLAKSFGRNALVTRHSWMFLPTYESFRARMLEQKTISTMAHLGARAFGSISGEVVKATAFVLGNQACTGYRPAFFGLLEGGEEEKRVALLRRESRFDGSAQGEFRNIPGTPIAYWVSAAVRKACATLPRLESLASPRQGIKTGDNERFLRLWHEVSLLRLAFPSKECDAPKWFPCTKGGSYRKWYGNYELVLNWGQDGHEIRHFVNDAGRLRSRPQNTDFFFKPGITWSGASSADLSMRVFPPGFAFESKGSVCFPHRIQDAEEILCALNSKVATVLLKMSSPNLDYSEGAIADIPFARVNGLDQLASTLIAFSRVDWDAYERSWDFQSLPLLTASNDPTPNLESSYTAWIAQNRDTIAEMKRLEEENNRLFIVAYDLADELGPDVPIEQITLTVNPAYRYGGKLTEEEQWTRFRQDSMQELVSYAIGCMMGRYSLDAPGLIYAHSGNEGFDPTRYTKFPADEDGIVPITDAEWFEDDAANRIVEFVSVAWNKRHLEANLQFLADNLKPKKGESSRDTIRRYLCDSFFKDHLQTYKRRPIYWLFSSGKQGAFQCLVYLHRYNPGTLSRMRSEYVIPLQGKLAARLDQLQGDIQAATSTAHQKHLEKELARLQKQQVELLAFDEKLRHYADQRIALDLDDGVKVNYGKFSDLLAEVDKVTGGKEED
ncbi:MAG: BREX-1 system adenine-specific DNA-methyltransferase PglX [Dehalococcoidia bacterium]